MMSADCFPDDVALYAREDLPDTFKVAVTHVVDDTHFWGWNIDAVSSPFYII